MPASFPMAVPEIPADNVDDAVAYSVNKLGFTRDFCDKSTGIAGVSRGRCRLFITSRAFRGAHGNISPTLFWINLESKSAVDDLYVQWQSANASIVAAPEDKPWNLREFTAADLDGNMIRVFYDFTTSSTS